MTSSIPSLEADVYETDSNDLNNFGWPYRDTVDIGTPNQSLNCGPIEYELIATDLQNPPNEIDFVTFNSATGVISMAPQDGDAVGSYNCAIKSTMTDYPTITTTTPFVCQVTDCVPVIYPPVLTSA